jgi:hypothetical protein
MTSNQQRSNTAASIFGGDDDDDTINNHQSSKRSYPKPSTATATTSSSKHLIMENDNNNNKIIKLKQQQSSLVSNNTNNNNLPPDEPTLDQYSHIPVEDFGLAMLRGMGYSEKDGIVGTGERAKHVEPVILNARPALLGLGAKPKLPDPIPTSNSTPTTTTTTRRYLTIGSLIRFTSPGPLLGRFGIAIQTDGVPGMNTIKVEMLNPNSEEWEEKIISRSDVEIIPIETLNKDHPGYSVYIAHEKYIQEKKQNKSVHSSSNLIDEKTSNQPPPPRRRWVQLGLIVKIVDTSHQDFKRKGIVVGISGDDHNTCTIKLQQQDEKVIQVSEKQLQTVIPKRGHVVAILNHHKVPMRKGIIVELNSNDAKALIKMDDNKTIWMSYDEICSVIEDE